MKDADKQQIVREVELKAALEERYLAYSLSTIMHRALPDVRDGLKPVHRRILYAMRLLKLYPGQSYAKCSRIVGDVMGKFHPHGDASIYDALVRLAQDFSMRYPLIDGQGNFGNIDGDNAAAMRYTEARLTNVSDLLLQDITENVIDFKLTYNEEDEEPVVLPAAFPNLLANGASGIAVGMATSIPPHNLAELCDAALYLLDHPDATVEQLLEFLPAPDFPTGGVLLHDPKAILEAYQRGRGSFQLRSSWHCEDLGRGSYQIIVTEIPWQVQKSRLVEKIAELILTKKLPLLDDVRDESAEDTRLVLIPKNRQVDATILMESLFKLTDLEVRIPLNMNVLSHGKIPNVLSLSQILQEWLVHRREVLERFSKFRLATINQRLEILAGYLIAYINLDAVIKIIREEDEPKAILMAAFSLTEFQAESILNMRLRSLRKLEEVAIEREFSKLSKEKKELESLLASVSKQWRVVAKQILAVKKEFSQDTAIGARRTKLAEAPNHLALDIEHALIDREPVTIILSQKGWIRTIKGHQKVDNSVGFKDGDVLLLALPAQTTDKLILVTSNGRFYTLNVHSLPSGRGQGEPIKVMIDIEAGADIVTAFIYNASEKLLLISAKAYGFIVDSKDILANTRKGRPIMNVSDDEVALILPVTGDKVALIGQNRKLLIFPIEQIPNMQKGRGVRLQRYRDAKLSDAKIFKGEDGLVWHDSADRVYNRSLAELDDWCSTRGSVGVMAPRGFPKSGRFE